MHPLIEACKGTDPSVILKLIAEGADVFAAETTIDDRWKDGAAHTRRHQLTALHAAVRSPLGDNMMEVVAALLDQADAVREHGAQDLVMMSDAIGTPLVGCTGFRNATLLVAVGGMALVKWGGESGKKATNANKALKVAEEEGNDDVALFLESTEGLQKIIQSRIAGQPLMECVGPAATQLEQEYKDAAKAADEQRRLKRAEENLQPKNADGCCSMM